MRKPERYLLKDTAMRLYHSKLKFIENQEMISLMLETSNIENTLKSNERFESALKEEWALFRERKIIRFNEKQIKFLLEKLEKGIRTSFRWKPDILVSQIQGLKVNGKFYFVESKFLTATRSRSFFLDGKLNATKARLMKMILKTMMRHFFKMI